AHVRGRVRRGRVPGDADVQQPRGGGRARRGAADRRGGAAALQRGGDAQGAAGDLHLARGEPGA
ncbi:unnamed protein product, partial [Heterosigma akashiwo]